MKKLIIATLLLSSVSACSLGMKSKCCKDRCELDKKKAEAPALTKEQMAKAMEEAAAPGEAHAKLDQFVGQWKTVSKFWEDPSKEPATEKGLSKISWVLGKRFLKEDFDGKWMGKSFKGMGFTGFDKVKNSYVSNWMDTASTSIMKSDGRYNSSDNTFEMKSVITCPIAGVDMPARTVTKIISNNEHVFEMYSSDKDGKEVKVMEINYKRVGK